MSYLLDILIFALPTIKLYTVLLLCAVVGVKLFNKYKSETLTHLKFPTYYALSVYVVIIVLAASSPSITWKNDLDNTTQSVNQIQQYNMQREQPKIIDTTKRPDRNSEQVENELRDKSNSWKEKKDESIN